MRPLLLTAVVLVACGGSDVTSSKRKPFDQRPRTDAEVATVIDAAADRPVDGADAAELSRPSNDPVLDARKGALAPDAPLPESDAGVIAYGDAADGGVECPGALCATFDEDDLSDWRLGAGSADDWTQAHGAFDVSTSALKSEYVAGSSNWTDVRVRVRVRIINFGASMAAYRVGVLARYNPAPYGYYAAFVRGDGRLELRRESQQLGTSVELPVATNQWHTLEIKVSGPPQSVDLAAFFDGSLVATATDSQGLSSGRVGLASYGTGNQAQFDDVLVTPVSP